MALTWKDFVEAWRVGAINNDASPIDAIITDDFMWETSDMDRQATIDWVNSTDFRVTEVVETLYENEDVIVGRHGVHGEGHDNMVMGVAYLRNGKVYRYHHQRKMLEKL